MNEIEHETPLSKGTVNNIIQEWKAKINGTDIEEIRGFIAEVRKSGITLQECAQAFRIANLLTKMGVYDEFDDRIVNDFGDHHKEMNPKNQEAYTNTEKGETEVKDKEQEEKNYSIGFEDDQKTNLLDLIRSTSSNSQDSKMTHYARTKRSENEKISNVKSYQITYFVNTIYKNCKHHGITPTILFDWIVDLFNLYSVLSGQLTKEKNFYNYKYEEHRLVNSVEQCIPKEEIQDICIGNEISLISRVSFFIEQVRNETGKLIIKRNTIVEEIKNLNEQKEKVQTQLSDLIEKEKNIISYLQWYSNLKQDLRNRFNLIIEAEFEAFSNVINNFNEYGYNTSLIIKEYKEFESLRLQVARMTEEVELKKRNIQDLQKEISNLELQSFNYRQTMSTYEELRSIGFGLKELKQLYGLLLEISSANSILPTEALSRFLKDLEKNYDHRLGLESKIRELKIEVEHLNNKVLEKQYHLMLQDTAAPNLVTLYAKGLSNSDIIDITNLVSALENSYLLDYKSIRKIYDYSPDRIDLVSRNEFWKLVIKKLKDINSINSEIHRLETHLKELENKKNKLHEY